MNATVQTRKRYTYEDDLQPIVEGKVPLPNIEDTDPIRFLNNVAATGHSMLPKWGYSSIDGHKQWTQFFISPGAMGVGLDGSGYAVRWGSTAPRVMRFAICKHEKVEGHGANHSRGWHPGHCGKCGLDLSIDSGD